MPSRTSKPKEKPHFPSRDERGCSEFRLKEIAQDLARELRAGDRVQLEGQLGAGKSTFARAILAYLGVAAPEGSPTFPIAHEYSHSEFRLVHLDFYRLRNESEIEDAGILEYFWGDPAIVITEWLANWPEFEKTVSTQIPLSGRYWKIEISHESEESRRLRITRIA